MGNLKATANQEIKKHNRSKIFGLFLQQQTLSRREIQQQLDFSLPTIGQNLAELLAEGLICEAGSVANTGGRHAATYSIVKDARVAVGVDITGHYTTVVLVDLLGGIIARSKSKVLFECSDAYYSQLARMVQEIVAENKISPEMVLGVGIGLPGLTDATNSKIVYGKILDFGGATSAEFGRHIPYPVTLYNDADAACFAEMFEDNGSSKNGFYFMLSTHVGGAVFINGSVYVGDELRSGEVGHMIIHPDGKNCYCGSQGCLDPYCCASNLTSVSDGDIDIFFQMLDAGYPQAQALWEAFLDNLVLAVKNVRMLFNCQIILGGYIGAKMDAHLEALKRKLDTYNTFDNNYDYLVVCRCRNEAIATGAALNHIAPFLESV